MKARIEAIETYSLILDTGCPLDLEKCLYVPECARNLISYGRFDLKGFDVKCGHRVFSLYKDDIHYGSGTLIDR